MHPRTSSSQRQVDAVRRPASRRRPWRKVPGRKRPGYAAQVPPLAGPFVLNKQGRDMSPHIAADLRPQFLQGAMVEMIEDCAWFVPADRAGVQDSIPEFGVAGTAGCADVETLVESTDFVEHLPAKGHVGAGAKLPGRAAPLARIGIK